MNYEAMSDFEINKAVAEVLFSESDVCSIEEMGFGNSDKGEVQVIHEVGISGEIVNYCNRPCDAWPIILENQISLINLYTQDQCDSGNWEAQSTAPADIGLSCYFSQHINPLRAAMIVFLIMQEEA